MFEEDFKKYEAIVFKSNLLVQNADFRLNTRQQKIMLYIISKIKKEDTEFELLEFKISEFAELCGIDEIKSGSEYTRVKKAIKEICDKSAWIKMKDGKTETLIRWIDKPYMEEGSGTIKIKLDNDLKPYLLQLQKNFTAYELKYILTLKSKYSIRFYEFLNSIHYRPLEKYEYTLSFEQLKQVVGADYNTYQNLNERVIKPIVSEINEKTNKRIVFENIKKGKAVVAFKIKIYPKELEERLALDTALEFQLDPKYRKEIMQKAENLIIEDLEGQEHFI